MYSFSWDAYKNKINKQKHNISFEQAQKVFSDPQLLINFDRIERGEYRHHAIGEVRIRRKKLLFLVVFKYEDDIGLKIRLISARKADKKEKISYMMQNFKSIKIMKENQEVTIPFDFKYYTVPTLEEINMENRLLNMKDEDIDYSDIPPMGNPRHWRNAIRGFENFLAKMREEKESK